MRIKGYACFVPEEHQRRLGSTIQPWKTIPRDEDTISGFNRQMENDHDEIINRDLLANSSQKYARSLRPEIYQLVIVGINADRLDNFVA
jgi:hypothetical protein